MLSFKKYLKETPDKEDIMAGLEELRDPVEKYIVKIRELRKLYDPHRGTVVYADWIQQHKVGDIINKIFVDLPISNDLEGELVIGSIDYDTESFIHDYIFQDYNPAQLALADKLLHKLLSDRYYDKNVSDEFYEEIGAAKSVLGIEDGEYEIFESKENDKEDVLAGLEEIDKPRIIADQLADAKNFREFETILSRNFRYLEPLYKAAEKMRADQEDWEPGAYQGMFAAADAEPPDPIDPVGDRLKYRGGESLFRAYEFAFIILRIENETYVDPSANTGELYIWAKDEFNWYKQHGKKDRNVVPYMEADDKEDILSGLSAAEETLVTQIEKTLEDLHNIREYVTSTLLRVRQEDPNIEEPVREDLRKYIHQFINKFLDKHPIAGSNDADNDNAIDSVHTIFSIFTEYAFLPARIKSNYVKMLEDILRVIIDDVVVNGKISEENADIDLKFEDIAMRAYKDAFPSRRKNFMGESKEEIMSGLEGLDEDDKIVQTALNSLKEQTKDPGYTNATIWINMFMDTYCPRPEREERKERGSTRHDKISHIVHSTLNHYINNYTIPDSENKKLFDELAYVLLYDVIIDHNVSDHFRQLYRQYQETLELPRIALYPQEYGYRESVNEDKEDILSGLEDVEEVNKTIREVIDKGKEYFVKLNELDAKRNEYREQGKDYDIVTGMAYDVYNEAANWAEDQAIRFTELVGENKHNAQSTTNLILNRYATDIVSEQARGPKHYELFEELITVLLHGLITEHRLTEEFWGVWDRVEDELELSRI